MIDEKDIMKTVVKKNGFRDLKCSCGSVRLKAQFSNTEGVTWMMISCKACNKCLYYNGA